MTTELEQNVSRLKDLNDKVMEIGRCAFWGCNEAVFYVRNEKTKHLFLIQSQI